MSGSYHLGLFFTLFVQSISPNLALWAFSSEIWKRPGNEFENFPVYCTTKAEFEMKQPTWYQNIFQLTRGTTSIRDSGIKSLLGRGERRSAGTFVRE